MTTVKKLVYYLGMRADVSGAKQATAAAKETKQAWGDLTSIVAKAGVAIAGALGALGLLTANTAAFAEEVDRSSRALNMSRTQFQEYKAAFDALGASTDDLMDAMVTVADRAVDAMEGTKEYVQEFKRVGIAVSELKGKKAHEIFDLFIERSKGVKDTLQVQAAAARLFGDDLGRRILPVMVESGESFASLRKLVRETGLAMDDVAVLKLRNLAFEMRRTTFIARALSRDLASELAPAFKTLAVGIGDILTERAPALMGFFDKAGEYAQNAATKVVMAFKDMNEAAGSDERLGKLAFVLHRIGIILGAGIAGVSVIAVIGAFASALTTLTPAVVVAFFAISSLVRYLEDLWVHMHGGDSLIGALGSKFEWLNTILGMVKQLWDSNAQAVDDILEQLRELFGVLTQEGPEGFSLFEGGLALVHAALTIFLGLVLSGTRMILGIIQIVVRMVVWVTRVFQTMVFYWDFFTKSLRDSAAEVEAIIGRLLGRFLRLGEVMGAISGEVNVAVAAGDPDAGERASKARDKALSMTGKGIMADFANLGAHTFDMQSTDDWAKLAKETDLTGAADVYKLGGRIQGPGSPQLRQMDIRQVNVNLPAMPATNDPAAWGKAAGEAFADEVLYSEDVMSSGVQ